METGMAGMPIRVLVVEDHQALAENLFEFLGDTQYALDFASDGQTALRLVAANAYDVIVLDVMLPGMSGFDVCRTLRQELNCSTPVIFMTARDHIDDKAIGFAQGGDDYLVKPFHLRELALRIDALSRRGASGAGTSAGLRAGPLRFDAGTLQASLQGRTVQLSGMGARIFEILVRAYPQFVSHEALADAIWGERHTDFNVLRTHVYLLRRQLQEQLGNALVKTLHGRGYRLDPPDGA